MASQEGDMDSGIEPTHTEPTSCADQNDVDSAGTDSATSSSHNAANRATARHSQVGAADGEKDSLFVNPASPAQPRSAHAYSEEEDEDLPPISELRNWARSQNLKRFNNSEEVITVDDDSDDSLGSLFVDQESSLQPPKDLVQPKNEDGEGEELPPSPVLSLRSQARTRQGANIITINDHDDEDEDSLFVDQGGRAWSPTDRVLLKNEDDEREDEEFPTILDWARRIQGSNPRRETITIDDDDSNEEQYATPNPSAGSISSDPEVIAINDDGDEELIPYNMSVAVKTEDDELESHKGGVNSGSFKSVSNFTSNRFQDGSPTLQENVVAQDGRREMLKAKLTAQQAKRDKILSKLTQNELLTFDEQISLGSAQAKIQEIEKEIEKLNTQEYTNVAVDAAKPKLERAMTSKQWFTRDNEKRKESIANKRKILYDEPIAGPRSSKKPKLSDMDPDAHVSVRKLQYSNPLKARMAQSDVLNPQEFSASTKKQQKRQHEENAPKDFRQCIIKADLEKIGRASESFGYKKCKAADGRWLVDGIKAPLFNHQMIGASWMLEKEFSEDKGGINADEMGMGKTIQTFACIVSNRPGPQDIKVGRTTTLVVAPASATRQWVAEIAKHAAHPYFEDVHVFKKSKDEPLQSLKKRNIIITSYTELHTSYIPLKIRKFMDSDECSPEDRRRLSEEHLGSLFRMPFWRVILDEAHAIKDPKTQSYAACKNLDATYRWCLTGTPIPNSVEELWPYLSFLQVSWAQSLQSFRNMLGNLEDSTNKERLETIMDAVVQRRTNEDTLLGKRLYSIPSCFTEIKSFPLSKEEEFVYRVVEARYRNIVNVILKKCRDKGLITEPDELQPFLVFLTRLRQATAHPFLLEIVLKRDLEMDDLQLIEKYLNKYGGRTSVIRQIQEWRAKNLDASFQHPALGTFSKSQFGHKLKMEEHIRNAMASKDDTLCSLCLKPMEDPESAECGHEFCSQCIKREVFRNQAKGGKPRCPVCDKPLSNLRPINTSNPDSFTTSRKSSSSDQETDEAEEEQNFHLKMSQARKSKPLKIVGRDGRELGNDYYDRKPRLNPEYTMFLRNSDQRYPEPMVPSAKTTVAKETVAQWIAEKSDDKIIIFTQFLEESQILGRMLQAEGINFAYYFGGLSAKKRDMVIKDFHEKKELQVLVSSLKCGGVALNITCANRVILADPWWNLSTELQAFCRVFRIGQEKTTHFVTLLAEKTIDTRIARLQAEKLQRVEQALERKSMTLEDFASLLGNLTEDENGNKVIRSDFTEE